MINDDDLTIDDIFSEEDFSEYEIKMEGADDGDIITMPYHPKPNMEYIARDYQEPYWDMFNFYTEEDAKLGYCSEEDIGEFKRDSHGMILKEQFKRIIFAWHRRAGKDFDTWQRFLVYASVDPGVYYYMLPTASQAKKVIFDGMSNDADRFIDFLPKAMIKSGRWNSSEMKCELINGSIIQILGSDNYDRIVGTNPKGIVFSEYALCNPAAWAYMRPILKLNGGFAWFISTPRGRNHFYDLIETARKPENEKTWTVSIKTIYDTGLLTEADYLQEIAEGMEESKAQQEYLVDFNAPVKGAYYSAQVINVHKEERYKEYVINNAIPVKVAFDIGVNDKTAIVFWQEEESKFNIIHYYENDSEGLEHYVRELHKFMAKHEVFISDVYFPHDMEVKEFAGGKKRIQVARAALPDQRCHVLEKSSVSEGIDTVRRTLPHCLFKASKGSKGNKFLLDALGSYHREYDDKKQEYKDKPVHDWSSHPADAFRYFAMVADKVLAKMKRKGKARRTGMRKDSVI